MKEGTPEDDPIVQAEIERAIAPYKDLLPADALAEMREVLADYLTTHPVAQRLVRQLHPPPVVDKSGDRTREDAPPQDATKKDASKKAGGKR